MKKEVTTGNPKHVGDCPICGHPCYEGLHHDCPTAPKIENPQQNNKFGEGKTSKV